MSAEGTVPVAKAQTWSIDDVLRLAREGTLCIPHFQRNFRWRAKDVLALFDSIRKGYPIGNLLVWKTSGTPPGARRRFGPLDFEPAPRDPLLVVDGQQRVTSLVATMLGGGREDATFDVVFNLETEQFVSALPAGLPGLPLHRVADTFDFLEWLQGRASPLSREHTSRANRVVKAIRDYQIPVYLVESREDTGIREMFVRINETGVRLSERDVFAALNRGRDEGVELGAINASLAELRWGEIDEDWLLKALAAVDGRLELQSRHPGTALQAIVDRATRALGRAIAFLRDDAQVPHWALLPYHFPLLPLVRFFDIHPEPAAGVLAELRGWLWRGAATGRHKDTSQPTVRSALAAAGDQNASWAARALGAGVPGVAPPFAMPPHDFRKAATKLACIAAVRHKPRSVADGSPVDLGTLLSRGNAAWPYIVPGESRRGTENRVLHPPAGRLWRRLADACPEVARSHRIGEAAQAFLAQQRFADFLSARRADLEADVADFLRAQGVVFEGEG